MGVEVWCGSGRRCGVGDGVEWESRCGVGVGDGGGVGDGVGVRDGVGVGDGVGPKLDPSIFCVCTRDVS